MLDWSKKRKMCKWTSVDCGPLKHRWIGGCQGKIWCGTDSSVLFVLIDMTQYTRKNWKWETLTTQYKKCDVCLYSRNELSSLLPEANIAFFVPYRREKFFLNFRIGLQQVMIPRFLVIALFFNMKIAKKWIGSVQSPANYLPSSANQQEYVRLIIFK